MKPLAFLLLGSALLAQDPDLQSRILELHTPGKAAPAEHGSNSAPAGPGGGPALDLPRDDGQHAEAPFERWVLRGSLKGPLSGKSYGLQLLLTRQRAGGTWKGSEAWRSDRWWIAQAVLLPPSSHRLVWEERVGREGLPASASDARLDLRVDGWTLAQEDDHLRLRLRLEQGQVELALTPQGGPLSLPLVEGRGLRRAFTPQLQAQGQLSLQGQVPLSVQGRFSLLHEWGPALPAHLAGWDLATLHFDDGRTWILEGVRGPGATLGGPSQLLEIDAKGHLSRVAKNPILTPRKSWVSPATTARYPASFQLQAWKDLIGLDPHLEQQEIRPLRPGAVPYYQGFCTLQDGHGDPIGEAFLEMTGYALPMRGF